jgi:hypothetical protein
LKRYIVGIIHNCRISIWNNDEKDISKLKFAL